MEITVDRDRCEGYGFCEQAAPAVFELDDNGDLRVLMSEVPEAHEAAVLKAINVCPLSALRTTRGAHG